MEFFGDRCPTDLIAALKDERLESGAREIEGRDQAVVAAADDHDIARVRHRFSGSVREFSRGLVHFNFNRSISISTARSTVEERPFHGRVRDVLTTALQGLPG